MSALRLASLWGIEHIAMHGKTRLILTHESILSNLSAVAFSL